MASPASRSASALPANQGHQRENGTERTSATAVTPASLSKPTKRSAARLEWPMVKRSQAADRVIGSGEVFRFGPFSAPPDRAAPRSSFPNVNGNRALAFVVVLHLTPARALIVGRGLEDAMGRFAGGAGLAVLVSLLSWPGHARADVLVNIDKSSQRMS